MKLIAEFEKFLANEVDLNKSRIETLTKRVEAVQKFLETSGYQPKVLRFTPQGSWAHKTIIKPPAEQGFDADLLVFVEPVPGWSAEDYVLKLKEAFKDSGIYKDKVHLNNRCVRIEYTGDFEIDLVPCVVNRPNASAYYEVCNRNENKFEPTHGDAYADWLAQRDAWVGNNKLREVTRLLKYLREIKGTFSCKSILLTTLLGERVTQADTYNQAQYFPDLPVALKTLVGRLDDYLQARPKLHVICNPVLGKENFNRHWDEHNYTTFREMIHKYRGWIDEAYAEPDRAASVTKWQRVFGDEFGRGADNVFVLKAENAAAPIALAPNYDDAVDAVKSAGSVILGTARRNLPWVQAPPWNVVQEGRVSLEIRATLHDQRNGPSRGAITSGTVLQKNKSILFEAFAGNGIPIARIPELKVQWQVVNTDRDAFQARQLRGGFYHADKPGKRWESSQYRGIHWVEAFAIRKRDEKCVGRSSPFFVVIE